MEFLKDFKGMSTGFPLGSYGFCMVLRMVFHVVSLGFLLDFLDFSLDFYEFL